MAEEDGEEALAAGAVLAAPAEEGAVAEGAGAEAGAWRVLGKGAAGRRVTGPTGALPSAHHLQ